MIRRNPQRSVPLDPRFSTLLPGSYVVLASTLLLILSAYAAYSAFTRLHLPGFAYACICSLFLCPTLFCLAIRDLVRCGLSLAGLYCAIVSLLGCVLVGYLLFSAAHPVA